ncbi:MAG: hypothetical protein ACR2PL_27195 [Dehalococcoidia bacterium]
MSDDLVPRGGRPYLLARARVEPAMLEQFRSWHRTVHLPHMLAIPGVVEAMPLRIGGAGVNSVVAYLFENEAAIRPALNSKEAALARNDWQEWLPFVRGLSIQIYTTLGVESALHHWN